jgi:hypothetical protein
MAPSTGTPLAAQQMLAKRPGGLDEMRPERRAGATAVNPHRNLIDQFA